MPHRRQVEPACDAGEVPVELFDYRADVWETDETTSGWYHDHGLPTGRVRAAPSWWDHARQRRRADALAAWAIANGYRSTRWPAFPDWAALRGLGLVAGSPTGSVPAR